MHITAERDYITGLLSRYMLMAISCRDQETWLAAGSQPGAETRTRASELMDIKSLYSLS